MEIFFWSMLFIFGMLFGSFGSVVIHRLYSGESWICNGRSHCGTCNHILSAADLIPVLSWLVYRAKCCYCKKPIPKIYPLLELSTGILFALIGFFFIDPVLIFSWNLTEILKLLFWLTIGFISILYTFYDILFLEIHEGMMATWVIIAFLWVSLHSFGISLLPHIYVAQIIPIYPLVTGILLSVILLICLYIIILKELKTIYDIAILIVSSFSIYLFLEYFQISLSQIPILSGMTAGLWIFIFFFLQIVLSGGRALGGWDLRIALMVGLLLTSSLALAWTMITYIVWSIIGIYILCRDKRIKKKKKPGGTQLPFWPFLAVWCFITLFFSPEIFWIIERYFYI